MQKRPPQGVADRSSDLQQQKSWQAVRPRLFFLFQWDLVCLAHSRDALQQSAALKEGSQEETRKGWSSSASFCLSAEGCHVFLLLQDAPVTQPSWKHEPLKKKSHSEDVGRPCPHRLYWEVHTRTQNTG